MTKNLTMRSLMVLAFATALVLPGAAGRADDTLLFSTTVAPNVLLVVDNSGSMEHIVWHPDFDPDDSASWGCNHFSADADGNWSRESVTSDTSRTYCSNTRTLYHDSSLPDDTRWDHRYLNWYFGLDSAVPAEQAILNDIAATANGTLSACLGGGTYSKYRRSRATASQLVIREVICQVNNTGKVRFGMAQYRDEGDPEGGHVIVEIDDYSTAQDAALQTAINNITPETWTPLGETLFQIYTYFMSRTTTDIPYGTDGVTRFPAYSYSTDATGEGGAPVSPAPVSPVQYDCQKNFVIVITDGEPTRDDFDDGDTTPGVQLGFQDFKDGKLIPDYNPAPAGEVEDQDDAICSDCETSMWLDDIAKYMHEVDFRPDMADGVDSLGNPVPQTIDVYTVGFTTSAFADDLLNRAAVLGGGQFYKSNNAEELAEDLVAAITDIIQKSQAFTAATVPATRTADGGNFYSSFFIPSGTNPFWEGHIRNFTINAAGQILDAQTPPVCALDDPSGNCLEGQFLGTAVPHWDAADEMPAPDSRTLYTSAYDNTASPSGSDPEVAYSRVDFDAADLDNATEMAVTYPPAASYSGSNASSAEELADELVQYLRGCEFGTGVAWSTIDTTCLERQRPSGDPRTLGDIFHSDPVVVGHPNLGVNETSYVAFATTYNTRQRILFAGANDGFLHAFDAGTWDSLAEAYNHGTGVEQFGFMPWSIRETIQNLPVDIGSRDHYFVDGSPQAADVWFYPSHTTVNKAANGSEWRTVLIGGLRQGGNTYYALDVTNPAASGYPGYLWEFPREGGSVGFDASGSFDYMDYMGETWSDPVIARVKVLVPGDPTGETYERWVAIFGGGYDPTGDPNSGSYDATTTASTSRKGRALFMVDVQTGRVLAAQFYHHNALDTGLGTTGGGSTEMKYAFASTPAVIDEDFDGFADIVYIGDLGGNLWKWVITSTGIDTVNPFNADGSDRFVNKRQSAWEFGIMFQAPVASIGGTPYYKSFFFPPSVTYVGSSLWLAVGTGERANPGFDGADPADDSENNRFYAIKDPNKLGLPDLDADSVYTTADILVESDTDGVPPERGLTDLTTFEGCATVSNNGWYLIAREGEKFVTNTEIIAYYVFAGSFIPTPSLSPCDSGGSASLYIFKIQCGEGFWPGNSGAEERRISLGDGMPTSPRLSLGEENQVYIMTSENELKNPPSPPLPTPGQGILYWRELE